MLANGPISFKVGLQSIAAQPTKEAELVAAAFIMKEAVVCFDVMGKIRFEKKFSSVPLYLDNNLRLHIAGNRAYSSRAKDIALRYCFLQELVEEGKITIYYVNAQHQLADLDTKHLGRHRHRALIKVTTNSKPGP